MKLWFLTNLAKISKVSAFNSDTVIESSRFSFHKNQIIKDYVTKNIGWLIMLKGSKGFQNKKANDFLFHWKKLETLLKVRI
jgi:hypothetical protein